MLVLIIGMPVVHAAIVGNLVTSAESVVHYQWTKPCGNIITYSKTRPPVLGTGVASRCAATRRPRGLCAHPAPPELSQSEHGCFNVLKFWVRVLDNNACCSSVAWTQWREPWPTLNEGCKNGHHRANVFVGKRTKCFGVPFPLNTRTQVVGNLWLVPAEKPATKTNAHTHTPGIPLATIARMLPPMFTGVSSKSDSCHCSSPPKLLRVYRIRIRAVHLRDYCHCVRKGKGTSPILACRCVRRSPKAP